MIGDPVSRVDGRLKVTGAARYSAEWPIDKLAYGVIVQSTVAKGMITAIDVELARSTPGVIAVYTADNAPRLTDKGRAAMKPPSGRELSLLQDRRVRYNGEPIGLVVAETFEQATHAASLVRAQYESHPPLIDMQAALASAYPYPANINGTSPSATHRGNFAAGLAEADAQIDVTFTAPIETHNSMEPHNTIAQWDGDQLTLYDSTQFVYGVKRFAAKIFELPEANVRVISHFTGGAFGSKGSAWSHVILAAMAARALNRPVKVVLSRKQMFGLVGARPHTVQYLALGAKKDGTLTAMRHRSISSTSTLEEWVEPVTLATRLMYSCPNQETAHEIVRLDIGTPTFNRGPGESSGVFALESGMDELAVKLGMDPIELRLRNYAERDPESGLAWSSKSLRECYALGAAKFGWSRRRAEPRSVRDGDAFVGIGMSSATYPARRAPASALARIMPDGMIVVQAATHELGTGTYTIMTQIAADALAVPIERVRFELGDTRLPENPISAGSLTAQSTGTAVHLAAIALRDKLAALGGSAVTVASAQALVAGNGGQPIEARADAKPGDEAKAFSMHSFGAVFAEVRVDASLGSVQLSRMLGAYGVGRILNPKTARSQMIGGMIYGLGMALTEDTILDLRTGRYLNADLAEYLVPVNADIPEIDVLFMDEHDPQTNPLGTKGIGEIGCVGVAAAIANAVYNATGVRVRELPITVEKLMGGARVRGEEEG
jgi:xanthine dehydrogenase YagR molybdenum-binding subunit